MGKYTWYTVYGGPNEGVYGSYDEAFKYSNRVPGSTTEGFINKTKALRRLQQYQTKRSMVAGSLYDEKENRIKVEPSQHPQGESTPLTEKDDHANTGDKNNEMNYSENSPRPYNKPEDYQ
jgi:hypothetical protein